MRKLVLSLMLVLATGTGCAGLRDKVDLSVTNLEGKPLAVKQVDVELNDGVLFVDVVVDAK